MGCLFMSAVALAQKPGVKLLAKPSNGSILLRWAPTNSLTWSQANQNGYYIERYAITRKHEVLKKPEKVLLTSKPLRPKPLVQWRADAQKNDYSAVAAQAIYGSSFQVTLPQNGSLAEVVNRSKEQEQRFSFALFAADHSFQTAKLSALGFNDSTAKEDERYLYRVYVANNYTNIKLDTGIFYVGLQDTVGLTPPLNLTAQFADRVVLLRWPKSFVQQMYTSFVVERSESGNDFVRRNSSPYINPSSGDEAEMFFQVLDSLPKNGVEYQYRIRGITPFGEIGPESERVSGKGFQTLDAKAVILEAKEENGKVYLLWRLQGNQNIITGQFVERANDVERIFQRVHANPLNGETTGYVDHSPQSTNYYRINLLGENGQSSISFPVLIQLVDSIPPAQPQGLKVKIDTSGVAKLSWSPNHETDLLGYKLYRSNFASAEFSEINHSVLTATAYTDSVNVKTLSTNIFYKLAAFDKRMNRSLFSTVVEVELPDVIPPQPPTIKDVQPQPNAIFLAWVPSASSDVASYELQRRPADSSQWRPIRSFATNDSSFYHDKSVTNTSSYQYQIVAVDKSKLKSLPSNTVWGKALSNHSRPVIKNFSAQVDREKKSITLQWRYDERDVAKYLIYRAAGDEPMTLYKSVSGKSESFVDVGLKMNTDYQFRIKCVFKDGSDGLYSSVKKVKY